MKTYSLCAKRANKMMFGRINRISWCWATEKAATLKTKTKTIAQYISLSCGEACFLTGRSWAKLN